MTAGLHTIDLRPDPSLQEAYRRLTLNPGVARRFGNRVDTFENVRAAGRGKVGAS